ncbi:MAG TPA: acyl-CoA dehydrogenase family protein, partial [Acidimicrobiales bacterium]|nr:acyl-CoA dehydrogenase family protein [Acidimicrobiales bacterium]
MDFELSDDQLALADAARSLLDGLAAPPQVRAHMASGEPYDAKLWRSMAKQGWMGVDLPEEHGGLGLGFVEAAVLLEEIGRHTAPAPFLPTLLAIGALRDALDMAEVAELIPLLLAGDAVGCVAWASRPDAVRVEESDTGWLLTGRGDPVVAAPAADLAVVWTP